MYKKCKNPLIEAITLSEKSRRVNLSSLQLPDGTTKSCVWCLEELTGKQQRWCGPECTLAATAWANPQKTESLSFILVAQDYKCAGCSFDYSLTIIEMYQRAKVPYGIGESKKNWRTKPGYWLTVRLKKHFHKEDPDHRLEVDHIVPIRNGGLPLDRNNLQLLCFTCHKVKSKKDNSGPRKKKVDK